VEENKIKTNTIERGGGEEEYFFFEFFNEYKV
jgi:hypothetical protein